MDNKKLILNQLLDIGGIATKNNFYSPTAETMKGVYVQIDRYFKEYIKDGLIKALPTITRTRTKMLETFYCLTSKGAKYIGRPTELKQGYPRSPNNVMHDSMVYDIALSFVRNFPNFEFRIKYNKILRIDDKVKIKPDIFIKMKDLKTEKVYHFLVELERKKTVDTVYKNKVDRYESVLSKLDLKQAKLSAFVKVLIVHSSYYFNGFLRPQQYVQQYDQDMI